MATKSTNSNKSAAEDTPVQDRPAVTTTESFAASTADNSVRVGPTDDGDKAVKLTSPDGTKVTAPERTVESLKGLGYK